MKEKLIKELIENIYEDTHNTRFDYSSHEHPNNKDEETLNKIKAELINKILNKIKQQAEHTKFILPTYRYGQSLYNTAYKYVPVLCEKITGTVKDPFYNNGSIDMFMDSIYEYLNKQDEETLKVISEK